MSVSLKPKFRCLSSIINIWSRSSSFNVRKMMVEFVQCSIKWCSTHCYKGARVWNKGRLLIMSSSQLSNLYLPIAKPNLPFQQKRKAHGRFLESGPFPKSVPTTCYWVSTDFLDYCEKLAIAGEGEEEVRLEQCNQKSYFFPFFRPTNAAFYRCVGTEIVQG